MIAERTTVPSRHAMFGLEKPRWHYISELGTGTDPAERAVVRAASAAADPADSHVQARTAPQTRRQKRG